MAFTSITSKSLHVSTSQPGSILIALKVVALVLFLFTSLSHIFSSALHNFLVMRKCLLIEQRERMPYALVKCIMLCGF